MVLEIEIFFVSDHVWGISSHKAIEEMHFIKFSILLPKKFH